MATSNRKPKNLIEKSRKFSTRERYSYSKRVKKEDHEVVESWEVNKYEPLTLLLSKSSKKTSKKAAKEPASKPTESAKAEHQFAITRQGRSGLQARNNAKDSWEKRNGHGKKAS